MNGIINGIKNLGGTLKNTANNLFTQLKQNISNIFNNIKTTIGNSITTARNVFSGAVTGIKNLAINGFNALKGNVSTIFDNIKNAITSPIETAKNIIGGIIDTIKGFFNFRISLPHIPMPHFSIQPYGWSIGDLLHGELPSLGIDWYDKAMDNPMILDSPTLFGYQNGNFLGGGESGEEVVSGKDTLMRMIQEAVATNNDRMIELLEKILSLLAMYMPKVQSGDTPIVLDTGALVSALAPRMDRELGVISRMKERGR